VKPPGAGVTRAGHGISDGSFAPAAAQPNSATAAANL